MFSLKAIERFQNPRNAKTPAGFNLKGRAGDIECSDLVELYLVIDNEKIKDAGYKVYGCPGAICTTDVFIDMIKDKTIKEASKITEQDISKSLDGLPLSHMHCSSLSIQALRDAIKTYRQVLLRKK